MAVNPLPTTGQKRVVTGGSNSSSTELTATTTAVRRLLGVTVINDGTNTASVRLYAATASSGQPIFSARLTGGQYSSQSHSWGEEGISIASGFLIRGALGTLIVNYHYTNE